MFIYGIPAFSHTVMLPLYAQQKRHVLDRDQTVDAYMSPSPDEMLVAIHPMRKFSGYRNFFHVHLPLEKPSVVIEIRRTSQNYITVTN